MPDERLLRDARAREALADLHRRALNFDPAERDRMTPALGWRVDDYCQPLPAEPPGPPVAGGSWEVARGLMERYEFADPSIIRAIYYPDDPLRKRDMLLEARFYGLRFHLGVRVGAVRDETATVGGRAARIWGWDYRTLQGHLEMGQMDYEVWKWIDTGRVEFRIHVVSRAAQIRNPVVRLGFRLFGRREQVRFARHACERIAKLTAAELAHGASAGSVPRAADTVAVRPASATGAMERKLAERSAP